MGEWVIGAFINLFGSIAINFGTNLLKLGHDQRERLSMLSSDGTNKLVLKPIIHFHTWRVGILFFALGNCLNFISFGYAAQSLLAALGSIQFVSNIAFSYFVLSKAVTVKVMVATSFIVFGNVFLVFFGNHQSPVYTPEQLREKYSNLVFLLYCLILVFVVALSHYIYRRGEMSLSVSGSDPSAYLRTLLPFSYATVSGAVGSCSVLFAKSLSNLLRLTMSRNYQLHSWFTYSMLLLFLSTAGFWMARLNEGLSLFDAILIVPMFQIAWTFFSICTGFVYFQEYLVFDALRITMFLLGMTFVFIGISLLAPDDPKGGDSKDSSLPSSMTQGFTTVMNRLSKLSTEETESKETRSFSHVLLVKAMHVLAKAKAACSLSLGLGEESISTSSVLVMPMVSSRMTGFRGTIFDRAKLVPPSGSGWSSLSVDDDDDADIQDTSLLLPQTLDVEVVGLIGALDLTVKVRNISTKATVADLMTFFSYCGAVDQIQLQRDGECLQLAFVTFKQPYALQTALLLDDAIILDRRVRIFPLDQSTNVPIVFSVNNKPQAEKAGLIPSPQSVVHSIALKGKEVLNKAKKIDERFKVTEAGRVLTQETKTAISAAESMAGHVGSVIMNSTCFSRGTLWLSDLLDKTARYTASDLGGSKSKDTSSRKQK